jgi:hypothetical protein
MCRTDGGAEKLINKNVFRKPDGKISLGRHRHRWKVSIRIDIREIRAVMAQSV